MGGNKGSCVVEEGKTMLRAHTTVTCMHDS